jgi:hypothetical protein
VTTTQPAEIRLTPHQILAFYYALRLQVQGIKVSRVSACTALNRQAGRRWNSRQWLTVITPYYLQITEGLKPEQSKSGQL